MKIKITAPFRAWMAGLLIFVFCFGCAAMTKPEPRKDAPAAGEAAGRPSDIKREEVKPTGEAAKPAAETGTAPAQETFYVHTIKWSGESISIIAAWYTGDLQNWKILAEANPDINANRVHEGMKIRIPERMMTTRAPMTKEHVDSFYSKAKKPPRRSTDSPPKDAEPELFGPKELPKK